METGIFVVVLFCAYVVQGITGFAGGMLTMPVGVNTVGLQTSIMAVNTCGIVACAIVAFAARKSINWHEVGKICQTMTPFVAAGIVLDYVLDLGILMVVYGIAIIVAAGRGLIVKNPKDFPNWMLWGILVLSGLVQGMFASGGAFLVLYATQKLKEKEEFRGTLSVIWVILNTLYTSFQLASSSVPVDGLILVACCIPLMFLATFIGSKLEKKVSQEGFAKVVNVLLLVVGVILIATAKI